MIAKTWVLKEWRVLPLPVVEKQSAAIPSKDRDEARLEMPSQFPAAVPADERAATISRLAAEFDANPRLGRICGDKRRYIDGNLLAAGERRLSEHEFSVADEGGDRAAAIGRLRREYDESDALKKICASRAAYVSGNLLSEGLPGLSESEQANL